jgi:hypothetical protein
MFTIFDTFWPLEKKSNRFYLTPLGENLQLRSGEFSSRLAGLTGTTLEQATKEVEKSVQRLFYWASYADKYGGKLFDKLILNFVIFSGFGIANCHNFRPGLCCKSYLKIDLFTFALRESGASNQGQTAALLMHKNGSGAATRNSIETSIKQEMLRIQPLLANRVLIFRFQLLSAVL